MVAAVGALTPAGSRLGNNPDRRIETRADGGGKNRVSAAGDLMFFCVGVESDRRHAGALSTKFGSLADEMQPVDLAWSGRGESDDRRCVVLGCFPGCETVLGGSGHSVVSAVGWGSGWRCRCGLLGGCRS